MGRKERRLLKPGYLRVLLYKPILIFVSPRVCQYLGICVTFPYDRSRYSGIPVSKSPFSDPSVWCQRTAPCLIKAPLNLKMKNNVSVLLSFTKVSVSIHELLLHAKVTLLSGVPLSLCRMVNHNEPSEVSSGQQSHAPQIR